MSKKIISTYILDNVAKHIRRLKKTDTKYQPAQFDEELSKISSLDNHLEKRNTVIYSEATTLPKYAFYEQGNIMEINFTKLNSVNEQAFSSCKKLKKIVFPDNYSNIINFQCFRNCSSLSEIDLKQTSRIAYGTFNNCTSLKKIILRNPIMCTADSSVFLKGTPFEDEAVTDAFIYVPSNLVNTYKNAANWSQFSKRIKSLEEMV